jgi:hypothetical protein
MQTCNLAKCCNRYQGGIVFDDSGCLRRARIASVLIGIQFDLVTETWRYLLTLRKANLRRSAGESCFPGGVMETCDKNVIDIALREAQVYLRQFSLQLMYVSSIRLII